MKKIVILFFSFLAAVFFSGKVTAQEKAKTEITSVKQKGESVRFSIVSSKPFIFGNNRYVLYIGNKEFYGKDQSKKDGKGHMSFNIPNDDFNSLAEGAAIYLSYGRVDFASENMDDLASRTRCWALGKFSKSLLK